jgi:hypothetical protein
MCATTLAPEPSVGEDLMLESTLAAAHDRWMAEVYGALLPVTVPEATFWERWDVLRYLAERFPDQFRLERELIRQLDSFISIDLSDRLRVQGDLVTRLHRDCSRLGREPEMARELARTAHDLLEAVRLWCAEFELAAGHIPEAAASESVLSILGRMSRCCTPAWAVALPG